MDVLSIVAVTSIVLAALTSMIGTIFPAISQGKAVETAIKSIAQQPDESGSITRTLFVGLAMVESMAIYCFVISMILIFVNPFWNYAVEIAKGM